MQNNNPALKEIPFADCLFQTLPTDYTHNLAALPKEQRDAIAEDFRRWRLAKEWFEPRRVALTLPAKQKADGALRSYIATLEPQAYRDDMRRRLNILKGKTS